MSCFDFLTGPNSITFIDNRKSYFQTNSDGSLNGPTATNGNAQNETFYSIEE